MLEIFPLQLRHVPLEKNRNISVWLKVTKHCDCVYLPYTLCVSSLNSKSKFINRTSSPYTLFGSSSLFLTSPRWNNFATFFFYPLRLFFPILLSAFCFTVYNYVGGNGCKIFRAIRHQARIDALDIRYLTLSRLRLGDNKLIFAKRRGEYELVITEPEATNCFSLNFHVNIVRLSRKFCVYLHFTLLFTLWREHELRKRQQVFVKYKHVTS